MNKIFENIGKLTQYTQLTINKLYHFNNNLTICSYILGKKNSIYKCIFILVRKINFLIQMQNIIPNIFAKMFSWKVKKLQLWMNRKYWLCYFGQYFEISKNNNTFLLYSYYYTLAVKFNLCLNNCTLYIYINISLGYLKDVYVSTV